MSNFFKDNIHNNNAILDISRVQINKDAENGQDAVRKSQAETISATAVQAALVTGASSSTTAFTSQHTESLLNAKQDNLSVDSNYFTLVNNTLGFKDLGIVKPYKDTTHTTMAAFISAATFNGNGTITIDGETLDKMTFIFLDAATTPIEKSFVYLGTNHGNSNDFCTFSVDYNQGAIRSYFSGTGVGLNYTVGTGTYSLDFGTTATTLGAQTIPIDQTEFSTATGTTVLAILKSLETYIATVNTNAAGGQTTISTRLDSLSGVTGNNLGSFSAGLFADNQTIKAILQACETQLSSSASDRTAIRSEFAAADTTLQSNINAEAATREAEDTTLDNKISAEATARVSADGTLQNNLTNEALTRSTADTALSNRLDVIEGTGAGSISQAQTDSTLYTDAREQVIMSFVNANTADITKLVDSNIHLVAFVGSDGLFEAVGTDSRDGSNFIDVAMVAGEVVVFSDNVTLLGNGFKNNDKLTTKQDITAGTMSLSNFVYTRADDTDLTKANIGSNTISLDGSDNLIVSADSINRTQLAATVESDIDDKFSKTSDNQKITGKSILIEQTDDNLASSYGLYLKKTQSDSSALSGTSRGLLVENWVNTNGSGNPVAPCYAHNTITTHYNGSCVDMSLVISGSYSEANAKAGTAITAIGSWSVANDTQLGVNIGSFAMAEKGATSNISSLAYASTNGAGADRAMVAAITSQALSTFSATRTADPYPYNDIALVADAKYSPSGSKAFYSYGDVIMEGGIVSVPTATDDAHAVNLGNIKSKQDIVTFNLSSGSKVIATSLDLSKVPPIGDGMIEHGVSGVTVSAVKNIASSEITFTATGSNVSNLTSVTVYLQEFICATRNV